MKSVNVIHLHFNIQMQKKNSFILGITAGLIILIYNILFSKWAWAWANTLDADALRRGHVFRAVRSAGEGFMPSWCARGRQALHRKATTCMPAVGWVCSQASGERGVSEMKLCLVLEAGNQGKSPIAWKEAQSTSSGALQSSHLTPVVKIWGRHQGNLMALLWLRTTLWGGVSTEKEWQEAKGVMGEGQWWEFKYCQYSFTLGQGFCLGWHNCWSLQGCAQGIMLAELFYHAEVRNQKVKRWKEYCVIMTQICWSSLPADEGTVQWVTEPTLLQEQNVM